ncbi:MAG: pyridoxamine 5'-phosphate oxidase family protein [Chloroflexi bacterium]|nr:pyridoxamine 5'-phosphate oxidase family protein [Chloroflexota bacterium]
MVETGMNLLEKAVALANKVGHVFIATSDSSGWPHLAAARTLSLQEDGRIVVREWFCPGTIDNLQKNRRVSVVVWEDISDTGYQLLGEMEDMTDIGMLNGYTPEMESKWPLPQVESQLLVRVRKITDFKRAPHNDKV